MLRAYAMAQLSSGLASGLGPLTRFLVFLVEFLQHGGAGGGAKQKPSAGPARLPAMLRWRFHTSTSAGHVALRAALRSAQARSALYACADAERPA